MFLIYNLKLEVCLEKEDTIVFSMKYIYIISSNKDKAREEHGVKVIEVDMEVVGCDDKLKMHQEIDSFFVHGNNKGYEGGL